MSILKQFNNKIVKYDLLNKFVYYKTTDLPKIKKIILNFSSKTTKLNDLSSSILALEIITSKKGVLTLTRKANIFLKIRKGNPVGCKVTLRNNHMLEFLEDNICNIIPHYKHSNNLSVINRKFHKNTFSYNIKNLFIFNELEKNYYLFNELKKLDVTIVTSSKKLNETVFLMKSFSLNNV